MRLSGPRGYLAALAVVVVAVSIGTRPELSGTRPPLHTFRLTVGTERFDLQEVDVGAVFGCPDRRYVGVILKDNQITRWSFNVADTQLFLARAGCHPDTAASRIVGVAVPTAETAVWVVATLYCGASCGGDDVHVFRFAPAVATIDPATGQYTSGSVREEIHQEVGLGEVRLRFPRLVFYVDHSYKDCPSNLTRKTYEWKRTEQHQKFVLVDAVTYTSRHCPLQNFWQVVINQKPLPWPPDPEQ